MIAPPYSPTAMAHITNNKQYELTTQRMEELLQMVTVQKIDDEASCNELALLSELVAEYEHEHYPLSPPSLSETLRHRMIEMGLTQKTLALMLGVSQSRISDYLTGRSEPTLPIARAIRNKLQIDADIILGAG